MLTNRKRKYFHDHIEINGEQVHINIGKNKGGVYYEIITKMVEQLDIAIKIHGRILVYQFILSTNYYTPENKRVSNLMKNLKQKISRDYEITGIGYTWVREQERSKKQHYHVVLFLDGNKIQHPKKLNTIIKKMWSPHGHMPVVKNPFYYINRDDNETRLDVIWRISYMAKIRGKGYRDPQANDYQASRLKFKQ
jgi:hypothetical protein